MGRALDPPCYYSFRPLLTELNNALRMFVRHSWSVSTGSRMNSTRLDSITFKAFFRKTSQTTLCLLRFSAGQDMLTQEDKCLNWNSRLVEEVEVDCTRSLVCGAMWKFLVYRRIKTTSTCRKTVNKLIWEQIWPNLQDRRFDIWEMKTEFNEKKMKLVFLSCLA